MSSCKHSRKAGGERRVDEFVRLRTARESRGPVPELNYGESYSIEGPLVLVNPNPKVSNQPRKRSAHELLSLNGKARLKVVGGQLVERSRKKKKFKDRALLERLSLR